MHILRNSTPIGTLPPGEWLVQDDNAFQLAAMAERGSVELEKNHAVWRLPVEHLGRACPCEKALIIRSGAIGDLLLLTPALMAMREACAEMGTEFTLCCNERHHHLFSAMPWLKLINYPCPLETVKQFNSVVFLENVVELSTEKGQHATDAFADYLCVTVTDYRPVYKLTTEEMDYLNESMFKRAMIEADSLHQKTTKRIALQLRASARIRDYHMEQWGEVIHMLMSRGWEIMLIGKENPDVRPLGPTVKDCSALTFRQAAAVLATCDVFCGVDSSFFNLCPALGVPAIGLFGPVDWRTRIKEGSGQVALSGVADCAPCGWTNSRAGVKFPPGMPCSTRGFCVPLAEIKPERIAAVIEREARK